MTAQGSARQAGEGEEYDWIGEANDELETAIREDMDGPALAEWAASYGPRLLKALRAREDVIEAAKEWGKHCRHLGLTMHESEIALPP